MHNLAGKAYKISVQDFKEVTPQIFLVKKSIRIFFIIFIFVIAINLFNISIANSSNYLIRSLDLKSISIETAAERGLFYDSKGRLLAKNIPLYNLALDIQNFVMSDPENKNTFLSENSFLNLTEEYIKNLSAQQSELLLESFQNLNEAADAQLKYAKYHFIKIKFETEREYDYPYELSHVVGYVSYPEKGGGLKTGAYKFEKQYESFLKGQPGKEVASDGIEFVQNSIPGANVYLTIDLDWQTKLYEILKTESERFGASGAAGIIAEAQTGRVVANVSYPGFNTNSFVKGVSTSEYESLLVDRRKPLLDKTISITGAPGSTFKLITSLMLLENGFVDINTEFFSNRCITLGESLEFCEYGKLFYGQMDIIRAIQKSSNLFFCVNTINNNSGDPVSKLVNLAKLFGIGIDTGIDLEGEIAGNMDSPEYKREVFSLDWFDGDTCNAVIGQGSVIVTPIQMLQVVSVLENGGKYVKPRITDKIVAPNGGVVFESEIVVEREIPIKQSTLDIIKQGMEGAARNPDGTVYLFLQNSGGNVRVKTGTAETYENVNGNLTYTTHGWIVGAFDYSGKTYVFSFHMPNGGGGFYIANSLRKFLNCVFSNFGTYCEY